MLSLGSPKEATIYYLQEKKKISDHKYERGNNIAMGTIPKTKTTRIQNIKSNIGRFFYLEV